VTKEHIRRHRRPWYLPSTMKALTALVWMVAGGAALLAALVLDSGDDALARPPTTTVTGDVIAARGRWTADGRTILTDAVVRTAAGDVDVIQLGGHADGRTMAIIHGPAQLATGQRVTLTVHPATSRGPRPRWLVDDVAILEGGAALPWVRTPTNVSREPVYWAKSCVQISRAREGTTAIQGEGEQAVMTQSMAQWNDATGACSYLNLVDVGVVDSEVGNDGKNLIKFRDLEWCRPAMATRSTASRTRPRASPRCSSSTMPATTATAS
jgi:hypothetical protein